MRCSLAILAICSLAGSQVAAAGTVTYDRDTFQSAVASSSVTEQNFDALPLGTITTVNGVAYTPSLGTALVTSTYLTTTGDNGLGSTSVGFFEPTETLTLTFAAPITAFAIDVNTYATASGAYSVSVNDGSASSVGSLYDVFPNFETGQFIGFTDTSSFTSVVLSGLDGYSYTVDTLVYGNASAIIAQAIPEPSEWVMFACGLPLLAACIRRQRSSKASLHG